MKVLLTVILIITVFLCVMNADSGTGLGRSTSFDLEEFLEWCKDTFDSAPDVFYDFDRNTENFWDNFLGFLADMGALIIYPIRFVLWFVPTIIDFVSTWLLPGVSL